MKPLRWPTDPRTTMSMPFMEMPQRAEASPWTTSSPPWPVAPADWLAFPSITTVPEIMFSARPVLAFPCTRTVARLFMPGAVVADVPVDLDLDVGVEAAGDGVRAVRVEHAPVRRPRRGGEVVQALVQLAKRRLREVDHLDGRLDFRGLHQTFARSQA